jgi:heterodisulfide reductase subunit A
MAQAIGVAVRAGKIIGKKEMKTEAAISVVNEELCIGCGRCTKVCPYGAVKLVQRGFNIFKANVNSALCKGCGACAAECPTGAMEARHFNNEELYAMIDSFILQEV